MQNYASQPGVHSLSQIVYQKPLDQPFGNQRLLDWINGALGSGHFARFKLVSAFAKEGSLTRLVPQIRRFREQGGTVEAIFGIDQQGTSLQALATALDELDRVHIWHHPSPFTTFHPKFYIFQGDAIAEIYIGSSNLTVGGLETNCEAGVRISFDLPAESAECGVALSLWSDLLTHPNALRLDLELLGRLSEQKKLLDETIISGQTSGTGRAAAQSAVRLFPYSRIIPPSVRPRRRAAPGRGARRRAAAQTASRSATVSAPSLPTALVIQIVPHHNGEVFLSKLAVNQSPSFFGFPFTGRTIPKKSGNPPYPQRTPDPITNWWVYDRQDRLLESLENFPLNTVFYERKGEIRITIPPEVARQIPPRSILLMTRSSQDSGLDYQCEVFPPHSPQYRALHAACTETMPGGGSATPRRFGWL